MIQNWPLLPKVLLLLLFIAETSSGQECPKPKKLAHQFINLWIDGVNIEWAKESCIQRKRYSHIYVGKNPKKEILSQTSIRNVLLVRNKNPFKIVDFGLADPAGSKYVYRAKVKFFAESPQKNEFATFKIELNSSKDMAFRKKYGCAFPSDPYRRLVLRKGCVKQAALKKIKSRIAKKQNRSL